MREHRPAGENRRAPVERDLFAASQPPPADGPGGVTIGISFWLVAAVALVVGIVIGFASGYTAGQRATILSEAFESEPDETRPEPATAQSEEAAPAQTFTEDAVPEPVRVDPEPIASAPEPTASAPEPAPVAPARPPADRAPQARRDVPVEPAASTSGSLQILSRPSGAQVFVDGRVIGRTPLVLSDVRGGSHDVRLELTGFRRWATSVQVTPGMRTRVAASLEQ